MAELKEILAYLLKKYPDKDREALSNARVTKMIFLSDWYQAIHHEKQISTIEWVFATYGPFVWDVYNEAEKNPDLFTIKETGNMYYAQKKNLFQLDNKDYEPDLTEIEKQSIDHVIKVTHELNWSDFIKLVYSTHPVMSSERYSKLDLIAKAKEYEPLP